MDIWWVAPMKLAVLVAFSVMFTLILGWAYSARTLEAQRFIPFDEEEDAHGRC